MKFRLVTIPALFALAACSQSAPPPDTDLTRDSAQTSPAKVETAAVQIEAPAGHYLIDINHANLSFSLSHLGLSNYVVRFTDYEVEIQLDPENLSNSSVKTTINPMSIAADYSGDFKGTHKDSPFDTWVEALARSDKFLNADKHPKIEFQSTKVEDAGDGSLRIVGDLSLLGQTHPITLNATVVGSVAAHPFTGVGAMGFSATGSFKRSEFGMNHLLEPPLVGDEVTLHFEGEFNQGKAAE